MRGDKRGDGEYKRWKKRRGQETERGKRRFKKRRVQATKREESVRRANEEDDDGYDDDGDEDGDDDDDDDDEEVSNLRLNPGHLRILHVASPQHLKKS